MSVSETDDLELMLRRIIREEAGISTVVPADKWRGGTIVLRPGTPGMQEKSWPIETFFHKIVMLRNRLRTLEQQVNASDLPDDVKVKLQGYVSGCYGSLTSFNVLFAEEDEVDEMHLVRQAQFLQHDRHLDAVRRRQRVELQPVGMLCRPAFGDGERWRDRA